MISAADFGLNDTIKVEHAFTFNLGEKGERPLRKAAETLVTHGYHWAESFRIVCYGLSAYFILSGLAKLVAVTRSTDNSSDSGKRSSHRSSSSSKSKTSSSKEKSSSKPSKSTTGTEYDVSREDDTS